MHKFITMLAGKHELAVLKYPPEKWASMQLWEMLEALEAEVWELRNALVSDDLDGEHGIRIEAVDVAVVAARIFNEMTRRVTDGTEADCKEMCGLH